MIPVDSMIQHDPENGKYGDCFRACIASLLELHIEEVPHVMDGIDGKNNNENNAAMDVMRRFILEKSGLSYIELPIKAECLNQVLNCASTYWPDVHYTLMGRSEIANHLVIGFNDQIVHDPSYKDHGIIGPAIGTDSQEWYWIGLLVKG